MNGILNILKPPGMTSFDVVGYLRGLLKIKKIGHTGTLDPAAAGVLPVCVGSATKAIAYMMDKDKLYRAEMILGMETDTQDSTGRILSAQGARIPEEEVASAVKEFTGKIAQIPPMYSAVKVAGKKLYELAREGREIERAPREVQIYSLRLLDIRTVPCAPEAGSGSVLPEACMKVLFEVACSKGTYIRTLCSDIGKRLGCGGHMSFLVRLKAGEFDLRSAGTLEEIKELHGNGKLQEKLTGVDAVFKQLPAVRLEGQEEKRFLNGVAVDAGHKAGPDTELCRVYGAKDEFIALGEVIAYNGGRILKTRKQF